MTEITNKAECIHCGELLPEAHSGICPVCGKTGRRISVGIAEEINVAEHLTWEKRKEFYEKRPLALTVVLGISFGAPFLGLALVGWVGVIVGLVLGAVSYWVGPFAVTKVREIEHGG